MGRKRELRVMRDEERAELERISLELLRPCFPPPRGVRLLGVTISNLEASDDRSQTQLALLLDRI